jgi:cell fate regulator YaaT (PSP1 superfamily)
MMSEDFMGYSEWVPSGESLEGLEDREYELSFEEIDATIAGGYTGPCGSCTSCATGVVPIGDDFENKEASLDIVEIEFKANRTGFFTNRNGIYMRLDSRVVVEGDHGIELGIVATVGDGVHQKRRSQGIVGHPTGRILRVANEDDLRESADLAQIEEKAELVFKEKCAIRNLHMKLSLVEFQLDRSRMTFYFTAERRVDFRGLVRDLAAVYHTRIELRQIGARDEAKKLGGVGPCGREICCATWMKRVCRVNVDFARYQNISLNPMRLGGACGRLKCCILFENQNYLEALEKFPPLNSKVTTEKGNCSVEKIDIFNDRIFLRYYETGKVETVGLGDLKYSQIQNH